MLKGWRTPWTYLDFRSKMKPVTERYFGNNPASTETEQVIQGRSGIIHGHEFFWKNGMRYIYGPDIRYYDTIVPEYKKEWYIYDYYYVSTMDTISLSYVDSPKSNSHLVTHMSESQWNLPRSNPHHLLNFPQEILYLILGFTLVTKDHTITPDVTLSNKRGSYKMSHSYTLDGKRYEPSLGPPDLITNEHLDHQFPLSTIITEKHHDSEGAYFMLHKVYRPMIDATILRVCKTISVQGTKILYGKNVFQFSMTLGSDGDPRYLAFGERNKQFMTLKHYFRTNWSSDPDGYFLMAIHAIKTQMSTFDLDDYLYYDHFIRFLHVIGPVKAAMIRKLHFHGRIVTHRCERFEPALRCEEDLYESLQLYIPLINKFCTRLQTLVIGIGEDKMNFPIVQAQERAIVRFEALEKLLRQLKTVRRLEINQWKEAEPNSNILEPGSIKLPHTFPELHRRRVEELERKVTGWFKERTNKWEHEENERQKTLMTHET
ncbi:hypothetical protein BOTCAL_0087g00010 [Botryotinia calthae]|uniref:Uncharacterized protein n=1 Tax=Botryotinia calthae TaxID=38488 RepID=A0A4Y8D7I0_9HELO|nr:hypothetical protein BOTCAL_0087g00010 [Botryotinia calthae]